LTELIWIIETLRTIATGGSLEPLFDKPGFVVTVLGLAAAVPATVIALGVGLHDWGATPLGRWLGAEAPVAPRSIGEIDADLKEYETWRDLDGDGRADF
jgi:hypothetical protein